jgi:sugar O-acyltransferase (sialic acid O-acetyltransferase NeuD family)
MKKVPVIVLGAGGHAKVLIDILRMQSYEIIGVTVPRENLAGETFQGVKIIGSDEKILKYPANEIYLVNGIGSIEKTDKRKKLFEQFKSKGYSFAKVIHSSAVIAAGVELDEGVQIMAGAIIQPGSQIHSNSIVNTKASIDHDCYIGPHVHLAPGVTLSGDVKVGEGAHIGTGATVIQGILIGKNSLIAAGALVNKDVAEGAKMIGIPAMEVFK